MYPQTMYHGLVFMRLRTCDRAFGSCQVYHVPVGRIGTSMSNQDVATYLGIRAASHPDGPSFAQFFRDFHLPGIPLPEKENVTPTPPAEPDDTHAEGDTHAEDDTRAEGGSQGLMQCLTRPPDPLRPPVPRFPAGMRGLAPEPAPERSGDMYEDDAEMS
jgi:hypothetical protein